MVLSECVMRSAMALKWELCVELADSLPFMF